jgi:hypothetical protein
VSCKAENLFAKTHYLFGAFSFSADLLLSTDVSTLDVSVIGQHVVSNHCVLLPSQPEIEI